MEYKYDCPSGMKNDRGMFQNFSMAEVAIVGHVEMCYGIDHFCSMDSGGAIGRQLLVLWKTHGSFPQILKKLPDRIRSGIGVVGVSELKNIQGKFYRLGQQDHIRKIPGTTAGKFDQHFQEYFQKVEFSVDCLEPFDDSLSAMDGPVPRPRSIMWKGLRFTLSDSI